MKFRRIHIQLNFFPFFLFFFINIVSNSVQALGPTQLPAILFTDPKYTNVETTPVEIMPPDTNANGNADGVCDPGENCHHPIEYQTSNRWNDMCRSQVRLSFVRNDGTEVTDRGLWVKDADTNVRYEFVSQNNPDLSGAQCKHTYIYNKVQFYNGTFLSPVGGPTGTWDAWCDTKSGSSIQCSANDTFAALNVVHGRPASAMSAKLYFAPLFGTPQEVELKIDPVPPLVDAGIQPTVNEVKEGNYWVRPKSSTETWTGYFNLTNMKKVNPDKLRVRLVDPVSFPTPVSTGSGIWKIRGIFDDIPTADNGLVVLNNCDALPASGSQVILPSVAINPVDGCPISSTQFPANGTARSSSADTPFEVHLNLNWGDAHSAIPENLGSYGDGQHSASLWFSDMAGNESLSFYVFKTDRYAPCDNATNHICSLMFTNFTDTTKVFDTAINSTQFKIRLSMTEASGSGIVANGSAENLRILVARQVSGSPSSAYWISNTGATGNPGTLVDFTIPGSLDKSCEENILSGATWNPSGHTPFFSGNYSASDFMYIDFNFPTLPEDTYWIFVCARDRAGNWSFISEPTVSDVEGVNPNRKGNKINMSVYNPAAYPTYVFPNNDTTNVITNAYVPALHKRLHIDKDTPDEVAIVPDICTSDPCHPRLLSPSPPFATQSELGIRIAYDPPNYTKNTTVKVGIKLPFDKSGIRGIYYYIGSSPPPSANSGIFVARTAQTETDCSVAGSGLIESNNNYDTLKNAPLKGPYSASWTDFCFPINAFTNSNLYIWLEDNAGNTNFTNGMISRPLFIDAIPPSPANTLGSPHNPTTNFTPTLTYNPATDSNGVETYIVCYWLSWSSFTHSDLQNIHLVNPGACPTTAQLAGRPVQRYENLPHAGEASQAQIFNIPNTQPITYGRWDFAVYGVDTAGNISTPSAIYSIVNTDGQSMLDYTFENEIFSKGGISPRTGSSGKYSFRVKFFDLENKPAAKSQVWIDINNNGIYEENEKYDMSRDPNDSQNNGNYWDGENYFINVNLTYNHQTHGKFKYRFWFENTLGPSIDGNMEGDPTFGEEITLDPYDIYSFPGMMQIRNNAVRTANPDKYPTILLKPPTNRNSNISVRIYDNQGREIKTLIDDMPYTTIDRYIVWDLTTKSGSKAGPGFYNVVYFYDDAKKEFFKIAIGW